MKVKFLLIVLLLTIFALPTTMAQKVVPMNNPYYDEKLWHYGFFIGVQHQGLSQYQEQISPAISLGIVSDWHLYEHLSLRAALSLQLGEKLIHIDSNVSPVAIPTLPISIASQCLYIPVGLKYSANRLNNYRPYIYSGFAYGVEMANTTSRSDEEYILLKPNQYFFEIAVGCDLYLDYFKLVPELKISLGMNDLYQKSKLPTPYNIIPPLYGHQISLIFYFE